MVVARAKINGKPYAYTRLRDTYFHEVDPSALGFADFNNPNKMRSPQDFMRAANNISYTFNWFYVDNKHIAYFNSGANPERPSYVDPNLPTFGRKAFLWKHFNPGAMTEDVTPLAAHPHVIDQKLPDELEQPAGARLQHRLLVALPIAAARRADPARHRGLEKMSLERLISDMEDAGTVDLRGDRVLPWILKVIDTQPVTDPALKSAAAEAHRMARVGRPPHRPEPGRDLRAVGRDPDHGRLVAAAGRRPVQADARADPVRPAPVRPRRPGPHRLGVRHQLIRLRPEGPARPARRSSVKGPLLPRLLRAREGGDLPKRTAELAGRRTPARLERRDLRR